MASTPPTVRPHRRSGGPVATAAAADRALLAPVSDVSADQPPTGRPRRWRAGWLLALSTVVLLGVLAVSAWASPAAPQQPPPNPPLPIPTVDPCTPDAPLPVCHAPTPTTTKPLPTAPLPPPTELPAPTTCSFPGQLGCTSSTPTTTPSKPCTGEDCIPQPTPGPPTTGPGPTGPGADGGDSDCGITDISGCINNAINAVFRNLVKAAMDPVLKLLGDTAFTTPTLDELPGVTDMWNDSWLIVVACYSGLIMIGGILVMAHESVQNRYSMKEIAPRLITSFLASALSLFVIDKVIRLANALSAAVIGNGVDPPKLGDTLAQSINGAYSTAISGGLFVILLQLFLLIAVIALLLVYVVRVIITLILIVSAPLWVACHALPHTDGIARWCERALGATLAIQVAQSLTLIVAVNTFLNGSVHLFNSVGGGLMMLFAVLGLLYILFKIPFWFLSATKLGTGRSFLGGLVKAVIAAKTFGAIAGRTSGFGAAGRGRALMAARGRSGVPQGTADPPWPAQPRIVPTPAMVNKRLQAAHDADRARAARQSRLPSQAPQFLQPSPQDTTHDPAVTPANQGPAMPPEFSSAPTPATPMSPPRRGPRPGSAPRFQAAGGPRRRGGAPLPARPIRVASVPPQLRFQSATPPAPQPASPAKPTSGPAAPVFRQAHPEPRIGDAYRRTQSVPPPVFRAPKPAPGGEGK